MRLVATGLLLLTHLLPPALCASRNLIKVTATRHTAGSEECACPAPRLSGHAM